MSAPPARFYCVRVSIVVEPQDAEDVLAGRGRRQGHARLGGDMADGAAEPPGEDVDQRLEVMPVLVGLGVEDQVAVAGRKLLETAIAGPVLPDPHRPDGLLVR